MTDTILGTKEIAVKKKKKPDQIFYSYKKYFLVGKTGKIF